MASSSGPPQKPDVAAMQSLSREPSHHSTSADGGVSPRPTSAKVVSIAEPDSISPLMRAKHKELDQKDALDLDKSARQFRASVSGKRLSGRPSLERLGNSRQHSLEGNPSFTSLISESSDPSPHGRHAHDGLLKQVSAWLKHEKDRRTARKERRKAAKAKAHHEQSADRAASDESGQLTAPPARRDSESSEGSVALEQLASILERTLSLKSNDGSPRKRRSSHGHKLSSMMKRYSVASSDTDYFDSVDQLVPSCDAYLDNSKTMAYGAGEVDPGEDDEVPGKMLCRNAQKEREAWAKFKYEIVRLAHTLKLKGWRRVPLAQSSQIHVERLSGALTNAVYVVSPPRDLPSQKEEGDTLPVPKNPPPKLLLRIYGPQVEHLIDREAELQILKRLARKRIGPRMLGTFANGRFEEYFHAKALTPNELRNPDTSKQIAKRMRELHEGIDLLKSERDAGPFVWRNWDKWVDRCEQIVTWLDEQILENKAGPVRTPSDRWKQRGFICGAQWPVFRQLIEKYRAWLEEQYGGISNINDRLVFSHNDTQYGNILRLMPSGESPLLLPANEHKQLIVIDFEYSNANLPGLEFANHFTEWCYNYHDPEFPYQCNTAYYPTPEEQHRFIRSYLTHNPTFKAAGGSASNPPTPHLGPLPNCGSTTALAATATPTTISAFMLDSRAPPGERYSSQEQEAQVERQTEEEARRLMSETQLWRLANSAQWVAWGIVQAHIPGMPDFYADEATPTNEKANALENALGEEGVEAEAEKKKAVSSEGGNEHDEGDAPTAVDENANQVESQTEDEEFDYLGYAQERAMFVWGDAVRMGFVKMEELPEEVAKRVKIVEN